MTQRHLLPMLGPFAVLYSLADAASVGDGLVGVDWLFGAVAFLASLAPLWLRGLVRAEQPGARRTGTLGLTAGVALAAGLAPPGGSLSADMLTAVAVPTVGAITLDLALTVPRGPDGFRRLRPLVPPLATVAAVLGCVAALPPFELFGELILAPSARLVKAPHVFSVGAVCIALLLRLLRRSLGSGPEALAANAWAVMGLLPAVIVYGGALFLVDAPGRATWVHGLGAFAVAALLYGHSTLVNPGLRLSAGSSVRRALASGLTLLAIAALVIYFRPDLPPDPFSLAVAAVGMVVLALALYRATSPVVRWLLAPAGGRLLDAVATSLTGLSEVTALEGAGEAVLPPLRAVSADAEGEALLFAVEPPLEVRIDAAGRAHVRTAALPAALMACIAERPGELVVRSALEDKVVRRPDLRPLVEVLVAFDALCAVPLSVEGEIEGCLLVPRGRRRTTLSLEELSALESLGRRLSTVVSVLSATRRAQLRAGGLTLANEKAEEAIDGLEEEVTRLRADLRVLRSGRAAGPTGPVAVAYSPAMRAFEGRLAEVAAMEAPALLQAEGGSAVEQIGRRLHRASARVEGPFVVGDCVSLSPERLAAALFGSEGEDPHPGWLRLAAGGTLLLTDVAALGPETGRQLAEALAVRQVRVVDGALAYPLAARIVATSRVPLPSLVELGLFDPELERWLAPLRLRVPPLRKRPQDIPSLLLLALDRACRVLGRAPMGIEQAAVDALMAHDFPGNLRELENLVERAVRQASGTQVLRKDLPPLVPAEGAEPQIVAADPLEGTYAELEKRILEKALARAHGNKSEAARLLGLKRTTFLDKLRRHDLDGTAASRSEDAA